MVSHLAWIADFGMPRSLSKGSSFYKSDPTLGRGRVRFAFPKQIATLEEAGRSKKRQLKPSPPNPLSQYVRGG